VTNHSQRQPRNPTDNSTFSQIRTHAIIHETTSILPCRGDGGGLLHSLSPRDIAFSEGLNGFPHRSATLMDIAKRHLPLQRFAAVHIEHIYRAQSTEHRAQSAEQRTYAHITQYICNHSPPTPIWATEVGCPAPPLFGRLQGCFEFFFWLLSCF
jgi:hypothetical protein